MIKIKKKNKTYPSRRLYIKNLEISNYKGFKDKKKVELAPMVNLIFGKNSSGKSSIFQALRIFRQSYQLGNLTPFNYESPQEYRGKGGIDIDIDYKGIINDGKQNKELGLGVSTGVYIADKNQIEDHCSLEYRYKFVKNFYTNTKLVGNKTIVTNLKFSNKNDSIEMNFPKYHFIKEGDEKYNFLEQNMFLINRRLGRVTSKDRDPYGSTYPPYYYDAKIDLSRSKIGMINEIFDYYKTVNKKKLIQILELIRKFFIEKDIEQSLEEKKSKKKIRPTPFEVKLFDRHKASKDILNKFEKEVYEKKLNKNDRINWFIKNPNFVNLYNEDLSFLMDLANFKQFYKDLGRLINAIKNKKINNEKNFKKYFLKDIDNKLGELYFYKGKFIKKAKSYKFTLGNFENAEMYSISFLSWIFKRKSGYFDENKGFLKLFTAYNSTRPSDTSAIEAVDLCMNKMFVIPGLRSLPKKYFVKGLQTNYVGGSAENLAELLANPKIKKETNAWLKKLEIPYNVGIQSSGNYYEIIFKPRKSNLKISQMHIGLGYPIILPFIVQSLIARNKIILIEEPEVHLHPKLEADIAELICESSKKRHNQFIIETHSEDFLLRLLKNIRMKKIEPKDVSINYITNDLNKNMGVIVNNIKVNSQGGYTTPWKDDLFAERTKEFLNK